MHKDGAARINTLLLLTFNALSVFRWTFKSEWFRDFKNGSRFSKQSSIAELTAEGGNWLSTWILKVSQLPKNYSKNNQ